MPRKPIAETAATAVIRVRVTTATAAALVEIARLNRTSRAAFIREAVEEAVADCSERRLFPQRR